MTSSRRTTYNPDRLCETAGGGRHCGDDRDLLKESTNVAGRHGTGHRSRHCPGKRGIAGGVGGACGRRAPRRSRHRSAACGRRALGGDAPGRCRRAGAAHARLQPRCALPRVEDPRLDRCPRVRRVTRHKPSRAHGRSLRPGTVARHADVQADAGSCHRVGATRSGAVRRQGRCRADPRACRGTPAQDEHRIALFHAGTPGLRQSAVPPEPDGPERLLQHDRQQADRSGGRRLAGSGLPPSGQSRDGQGDPQDRAEGHALRHHPVDPRLSAAGGNRFRLAVPGHAGGGLRVAVTAHAGSARLERPRGSDLVGP